MKKKKHRQQLVTPTRRQTNFDPAGSEGKKKHKKKMHTLASSLASSQQTHDMLCYNH